MTDLTLPARSYAKALFALADTQASQKLWISILAQLVALMQNKMMQHFVHHPRHARSLLKALSVKDVPATHQLSVNRLLTLLKKSKCLPLLPQIYQIFLQLKAISENTLSVVIESAYPLSKKERAELSERLSAYYQKSVQLTIKHHPALIGGIKIMTQDKVCDCSILGKLQHIKTQLEVKE